ncbi:MAG: nucleotidyl transferase [Acidobacteria bacterium]|nr:nucleotidyl transferase [Acidobacteriota bacterium]
MLPVIVLAGGLATRLRPITEKIPKSLVEIGGVPFADHQMRLLAANGVKQVVMSVAYKGEMIEDYLGNGSRYGLEIGYSFDGETYLGTAGAIRKALPLVGELFLTLYGDSYLTVPFAECVDSFERSRRLGLMTVYRNEGQFDTSNVEWSGGEILRYDKRNRTPAMRHIDYGLGAFHRSAFDEVPSGVFADLADLYQALLTQGQLAGNEVAHRFYEIGTPAGIADTEHFLKQRGAA